jgi:hypothetical protein
MVSDKPDADAKFRSHLFDDDIVPIFFQPGFQLCPPISLIDAGVRPIFERRS